MRCSNCETELKGVGLVACPTCFTDNEMLTKYTARFWGREAGAVGVSGWHHATVRARNIIDAELALYETHDHIMEIKWSSI